MVWKLDLRRGRLQVSELVLRLFSFGAGSSGYSREWVEVLCSLDRSLGWRSQRNAVTDTWTARRPLVADPWLKPTYFFLNYI